jgi:hypothetical protein
MAVGTPVSPELSALPIELPPWNETLEDTQDNHQATLGTMDPRAWKMTGKLPSPDDRFVDKRYFPKDKITDEHVIKVYFGNRAMASIKKRCCIEPGVESIYFQKKGLCATIKDVLQYVFKDHA